MVAEARTITPEPDRSHRSAWIVPIVSLVWLVVELWAARGQIRHSVDGTVALSNAANALPGVIEATLVAGIGLALLLPGGWRTGTVWPRVLTTAVAGAVAGAIAGVAVQVAYPHLPSVGAITAILIVGLAQTVVSYFGESLIAGFGGNRPVLAEQEGGRPDRAAVAPE